MFPTIICFIVCFHSVLSDLDLKTWIGKATQQNISGQCYDQFRSMDSLLLIKMIDSNPGLKPVGLLEGNFNNLGAYDECLSIADESREIYGKYCLTSLSLFDIAKSQTSLQLNHTIKMIQNLKMKFRSVLETRFLDSESPVLMSSVKQRSLFGICIPNKCTNLDMKQFFPLDIDENKCYTKLSKENMNPGSIITISIVGVIFMIAASSTLYDIVCLKQATKPKYKILTAFSLYTNGMKLFKYSVNSDQLGCLHGIKSISMMWVILGHTYLNLMMVAAVDNILYLQEWLDDYKSMFILSATVSVDTFFTVGGFLTVYVYLKSQTYDIKKSFKMIPLLYLHRYIRLTPAFAIMILTYGSGLIKYFTDGPMLNILNSSIENCANSWWAALLYSQNYIKTKKMCVPQSWYLSVDFQLFILAPFLLIPLKRWPKYVLPLMTVIAVIGIAIPFYIGYSDNIAGVGLAMSRPEYSNYYYKTHTRFAPYVIGMIFGYYIYKIKHEKRILKFNIVTLCIVWILLVGGLCFCIFDGIEFTKEDGNRLADGFYLGFNRSIWSLILSIIILLCCTGNGGAINTFLSHPTFNIISKLSYSMYMTHYIIILSVVASFRTQIHFSNFVAVFHFFGLFVITLSISALYSLLFESPMIIIEKIIFEPTYGKKV